MGLPPRPCLGFPFLFGGTFIEGNNLSLPGSTQAPYFPSFSEGLSLRVPGTIMSRPIHGSFPFLFGGTFIEGHLLGAGWYLVGEFPFLFGGTFIEGSSGFVMVEDTEDFPSFSEGLSLRVATKCPAISP